MTSSNTVLNTNNNQTEVRELIKGLGATGKDVDDLSLMCKSKEDVKRFFTEYYSGKKSAIMREKMAFRKALMKERALTESEFIQQYKIDVRTAIENLALIKMNSFAIGEIEERIRKEEVSLKEFYQAYIREDSPNPFHIFRELLEI